MTGYDLNAEARGDVIIVTEPTTTFFAVTPKNQARRNSS